jgi:transposase InsO family protein
MLIAYKLQEIFGLLGYPKIFHTDNGKEFTASLILEFLRQLNPNILAVTGRPRRPRDQGSVENVNALVKRVLGSVLTERRLAGQNPNWTEVLGSVAAVLNSQSGRGRNDVSAYEAVFGCVYDHQFVCSKEEARRCWTIEDRMKVTNEPDFEEYVQQFYHVSRAADDDKEKTLVVDEDSGYFS